MKFAQSADEFYDKISHKLQSEFRKKKIWIASSTHEIEEIFCAKAHIELKKKIKNLLTIIIPRHIHRTNEIVSKIKKLKLKTSLHSTKPKNLNNIDIYCGHIW